MNMLQHANALTLMSIGFLAMEMMTCLSAGCENGQIKDGSIKRKDGVQHSLVQTIQCAPVTKESQVTERNKFTLGPLKNDSQMVTPYSFNEIPMGCIKYLPQYKTWFPDEKAWLEFKNQEEHYYYNELNDE